MYMYICIYNIYIYILYMHNKKKKGRIFTYVRIARWPGSWIYACMQRCNIAIFYSSFSLLTLFALVKFQDDSTHIC